MRNLLIATVVSLLPFLLSQPAEANSRKSYRMAYNLILESNSDYLRDEEFREYVLKWLDQDKQYPHKIAMSYCQSKRSGQSDSQINERTARQLFIRGCLKSRSGR
jgi:hypothetical protein